MLKLTTEDGALEWIGASTDKVTRRVPTGLCPRAQGRGKKVHTEWQLLGYDNTPEICSNGTSVCLVFINVLIRFMLRRKLSRTNFKKLEINVRLPKC